LRFHHADHARKGLHPLIAIEPIANVVERSITLLTNVKSSSLRLYASCSIERGSVVCHDLIWLMNYAMILLLDHRDQLEPILH